MIFPDRYPCHATITYGIFDPGMPTIKNEQHTTKKAIILEAAAKLFYSKGFSASPMRELAEQVGVEAASLYNHIDSKSAILQEICFDMANLFMTHMEDVDATTESAIVKLEKLLRFHIRQMIDQHEKVHVSDREWKHLPAPYLANYRNQRRTYRKRMATIIEQGIAARQIKDTDASTAVLIVLHAVGGIESWHRSKTKISAELLEKYMVLILIDGLRK